MSTEEHRCREARLHALPRRRDGVISPAQALALDTATRPSGGRSATTEWFRVAYRVYQVASHAPPGAPVTLLNRPGDEDTG